MKKKTFSILFTVAFMASTLMGCNSETQTVSTVPEQKNVKNQTKVTLNEVAHSIFYAPMYVAIEKGYFAEEGIDLELITGFGENILGRDFLCRVRKKYPHLTESDSEQNQHSQWYSPASDEFVG